MTDFATWLSRLVRIPSVNPLQAGPTSGVPGEAALATELAACFRSLGADRVELEPLVDGRPNVYAVVRGRTDRVVALDVHTDTVTVENMTDPPFDGRVEQTAIPNLLRRLNELGIGFRDLNTRQSSLEDIFVDLVSDRKGPRP